MSNPNQEYKTTAFDVLGQHQQDPIKYLNEIKDIMINQYGIADYLLAYEERNDKGEYKPHIHTIYLTTPNNGRNMVKTIVSKYKLTSSGRGGKRHYCTLKAPIRNLEKLRVYCSKDGNVVSSLPQDELDRLAKLSFKKDNLEIKEKLVKHLDEVIKQKKWKYHFNTEKTYHITEKDLALEIIKYMCDNKIHLRKSLLESYVIYYRQFTTIPDIKSDPDQLLFLLYSRDPYQINN